MNFVPFFGLENFHFSVIELSFWYARIQSMDVKSIILGILKAGEQGWVQGCVQDW
jgi:hypothetical protein